MSFVMPHPLHREWISSILFVVWYQFEWKEKSLKKLENKYNFNVELVYNGSGKASTNTK